MNPPQHVVLVPKATKVEYDGQRLGLTHHELIAFYRHENVDVIFASHERQLTMRQCVVGLLPRARIVTRAELDRNALANADLVVALGGDNHFIFVASHLQATPLLGINADHVRSHGGLLGVDERNVATVLARVLQGDCVLEAWSRLDVSVDGQPVGTALSEIYLGESARHDMSRHVLAVDGQEEEQRCSGLLVATGAGSTGWYGSYGRSFARTARQARWAITEPFPRHQAYLLGKGRLGPGRHLTVRSRNDAQGVVALDSLVDVAFPYGSVARLSLSPRPLHVVAIAPIT
jgi:NAD kinase